MKPNNVIRNQQIFTAFAAGDSLADLVTRYGLAPASLESIAHSERLKRAVGQQPYYRELRRAQPYTGAR